MSLRCAPRFVLLILLAGCATNPPQPVSAPVVTGPPPTGRETFEKLWDRVRIDSAGQQGEDWHQDNNDALEQILEEADEACLQPATLANGDGPDARFVFEIDRGGQVRKVHVSPISQENECRRNFLARAVFSPPPWDGYYFGVRLVGRLEGRLEELPDSPRARLPESTTLKVASRRARLDMGTDAGLQWMTSGQEGLTTALRSLVTQCPALLESTRGGVLVTFEIASDGAVRRVLVADAAQLDCARSELQRHRLAAPPWDGFWVSSDNGT